MARITANLTSGMAVRLSNGRHEWKADEMLGDINRAYGFIPSLYGIFAESPTALRAYMTMGKNFDDYSFSATERQLIILAVSRYTSGQSV